jgi:hypothetical protein
MISYYCFQVSKDSDCGLRTLLSELNYLTEFQRYISVMKDSYERVSDEER